MNDVQRVQVTVEQAEKIVNLGKALENLKKNKDYKFLISEHYLKEEVIRLNELKGDPCMFYDRPELTKANIEYNNFLINGIASFSTFTRNIEAMAIQGKRTLEDYRESLKEEKE